VLEPVRLEGQRIASSFWGKEWCKNLESYWTSATGFPAAARTCAAGGGRSAAPCRQIDALVAEARSTRCRADRQARPQALGSGDQALCWTHRLGGRPPSGRLSETVLEALVDRRAGLFLRRRRSTSRLVPRRRLALQARRRGALRSRRAARQEPELFFTLRRVALEELVARSALRRAPRAKEALDTGSLEGIFGIELDRRPRRSGR